MIIDARRSGPYLRALSAGLNALVPNDTQVPLAQAMAHLDALDPAMSGTLLDPAEVDDRSGMPAWTWLERARAEADLASTEGPSGSYNDDDISRANALDPALSRRLAHRAALHRFLRGTPLLPMIRLVASLRRVHRTADVLLVYDRVGPEGRWLRLSLDLSLPTRVLTDGTFTRLDPSRLAPVSGVQHLLTRYSTTPLLALQRSVEVALGGPVLRLSRGTIGPFWFPGLRLPARAPACVRGALVLHLSQELVSADVRKSVHQDPWLPPPKGEKPPAGQAIFRERRFAASPSAVEPLRAWSAKQGAPALVVALRPRPTGIGTVPKTL